MTIVDDYLRDMDLSRVDPNRLYDDADRLFTSLERHVELLQAVVDNRRTARRIIDVLDEIYGAHRNYEVIGNDFPVKNFSENFKEVSK